MRDIDAALSRAIRYMVILSLVVHSFLLIRHSSKFTGGWLDTLAAMQSLEDMPTILSSQKNASASLALAAGNHASGGVQDYVVLEGQDPLDLRAPTKGNHIPLADLINSNPNPICNPGKSKKFLINSTVLADDMVYLPSRRIPKIVHVTSKTRCMTPYFIRNIGKWRFPGYALYFHDDFAVDRLLSKYWPEFPQLQLLMSCVKSGAAKADIWRLLVLWEYGGIYTDIDNAPGPKFLNGTEMKDDDEAYFVVERIGVMSQYFMASTPKHPFLHIAITNTFQRLLEVDDLSKLYVPFVTGPGAIKSAMMNFMKDESLEKIQAKKYIGADGWSVTVGGKRGSSQQWIERESVSGIHKKGGYAAMGMTHFGSETGGPRGVSCFEHLSNEYQKRIGGEWTKPKK